MTHFPKNMRPIHFVGIGGIGMSGIAELLVRMGCRCTGSDLSNNANTKRLNSLGVPIYIGHKAEHVENVEVVVRSSAITDHNIEIRTAQDLGIPIISRAEMLAELMRYKACVAVAGSHGKSTTTSMIAWILDRAGRDPTVVIGGILNAYGTNTRRGEGDWMVVEADESDGSFLLLPHQVAVITNIDLEHLDYYRNFAHLQETFLRFARTVPFYGTNVVCEDDPIVKLLIPQISNKRLVRYGLSCEEGFTAENINYDDQGVTFDLIVNLPRQERLVVPVTSALYGEHNVKNCLAAIAVSYVIGVKPEVAAASLRDFSGVARRFTIVGKRNGATVVDDYAHHPSEISEVIKAARTMSFARLLVVFQPHRYTRLQALLDEFVTCLAQTDGVWIAPVYSSGESELPGISSQRLADRLQERGLECVKTFENPEQLEQSLAPHLKEGDVVIFMGAGSITHWAHQFVAKEHHDTQKKPSGTHG